MRRPCYALALRPLAHSETRRRGQETWSRCSASADLVISACNTRVTWVSRLWRSTAATTAPIFRKSWAHHYLNSSAADVAKELQKLGGAQVVLATASGGKAVAAALGGLRRGGVVISLGATDE